METQKTNFAKLIEDRLIVLGAAVTALESSGDACVDCADGINNLVFVYNTISGEIYELLNFIEKNVGTFSVGVPSYYSPLARLRNFSGGEFVPKGTEIKENNEQ